MRQEYMRYVRSWVAQAAYYRARGDWPGLERAERHVTYWLRIADRQGAPKQSEAGTAG